MTVISRERARATWLTGAAGLLMLGAAVVMMVVAAPSRTHPLPRYAAAQTQAYTLSMITESWSGDSSEWAARPPLARSAVSLPKGSPSVRCEGTIPDEGRAHQCGPSGRSASCGVDRCRTSYLVPSASGAAFSQRVNVTSSQPRGSIAVAE